MKQAARLISGALAGVFLFAVSDVYTLEPEAREELAAELEEIFSDHAYDNAIWGIEVVSVDGDVVYERNSGKGMVPASNLKLFTTAAAVELLGAGYTYETRLEMTGNVTEDGVLEGDIVIVGSGDPSLGAWHPDENNNAQRVFDGWVSAMKEAGIQTIAGDIVGDGRYFTEEYISGDWDYYDLPYWYAAGSSGLAIEENAFRTTITAAEEVGEKPTITWNPDTAYITIENSVETVAEGGKKNADIVWRKTEGNHFLYDRTIPVGEAINERGSIWDGARYAAFLLKERLAKEEIEVLGDAVNIRDLYDAWRIDKAEDRAVLAVTASPPLSDIITTTNRVSHNLFADMIVRTLGAEKKNEGSFDAGTDVVRDWLKEIGAPAADQFQMVDGSGLAQSNFIQPRQMTHMLVYMSTKAKEGQAFKESMSVGGESGWVSRRFKGTAAEGGKVRAKTGYIGSMRALSGYVTNQSGEEFAFSMICNRYAGSSRGVDELIDKAVVLIAESE